MRILLIGKDARTDALAAGCLASPLKPELYAFSEMLIPGLVQKCGLHRVFETKSLGRKNGLAELVERIKPDLVIIGPEEPLEAGYVDELNALGVATFGPTHTLARIETSKAWTRRLLDKYEIPGNPEYRVFDSHEGLRQYMEKLGDFVVKPDGLTGGKGVKVFGEHFFSIESALDDAEDLLRNDGKVQIEERLEGEEFSLQTITDGKAFVHCPLVQDHKRAFEGDNGPNTGGMGSYSCSDHSLPFLEQDDVLAAQKINELVIKALSSETGEDYRGVLYGGFIATREGVRLIEYNCRFGDPEAMNVLSIMNSDLVEVCASAAAGKLCEVTFAPKATVCKYIVPSEYPGSSGCGERIIMPQHYCDTPTLKWYWAACKQVGDDVYLTSSRSGALVGIGDNLQEAEATAEEAAGLIETANKVRHRADIGRADIIELKIRHMNLLRSADAAVR